MKMHLDTSSSNLVSDYGPQGISVNGKAYTRHLVVSPTLVEDGWTNTEVKELTIDAFERVLEIQPDIILLGTGERHLFVPPVLMADLSARGCALEVMTTSAACRTYNVLVGEYRNVVAVLYQIRDNV